MSAKVLLAGCENTLLSTILLDPVLIRTTCFSCFHTKHSFPSTFTTSKGFHSQRFNLNHNQNHEEIIEIKSKSYIPGKVLHRPSNNSTSTIMSVVQGSHIKLLRNNSIRSLSSYGSVNNGNNFNNYNRRKFSTSQPLSSALNIEGELLTKESAKNFLDTLSEDQKTLLYHTLNIEVLRDKYEGHLGSSKLESHHYLSKYGRPTAALGNEDPTGTLCEVPPKWLHTRLGMFLEKAYPPSAGAIWAVELKNALPFIGCEGDYIDVTIGISTMAAAALGNTVSDVAGIGSAWYVEELANKVGIKDPELTPSQLCSWPIRWASNGGRAIGVIIGCLLGMVPLLFLPSSEEKEEKEKEKAESSNNSSDSSKPNNNATNPKK